MTLHTLQISAKRDLGGGNTVVNTYHFHPDSSMAWAGTNRVTHANILIGHLKTFYNALGVAGLAGGYDIGTVVLEYETGQPPIYVGATAQSSTGAAGETRGKWARQMRPLGVIPRSVARQVVHNARSDEPGGDARERLPVDQVGVIDAEHRREVGDDRRAIEPIYGSIDQTLVERRLATMIDRRLAR